MMKKIDKGGLIMQILRSQGMQWHRALLLGARGRQPNISRPAEDRNQLVLAAGATNQ
jgi:hypothetical protein